MRKSIADNQKLILDPAVQKQMQTVNPALEAISAKPPRSLAAQRRIFSGAE